MLFPKISSFNIFELKLKWPIIFYLGRNYPSGIEETKSRMALCNCSPTRCVIHCKGLIVQCYAGPVVSGITRATQFWGSSEWHLEMLGTYLAMFRGWLHVSHTPSLLHSLQLYRNNFKSSIIFFHWMFQFSIHHLLKLFSFLGSF